MKLLLQTLLATLLCASLAYAAEPEEEKEVPCLDNSTSATLANGVLTINKKSVNGKICWEDANYKYEVPYKAGRIEGVYSTFTLDDRLVAEQTYVYSNLTGPSKHYYDNGKLQSEVMYFKGRMRGVSKFYSEAGVLQYEQAFDNGKRDGVTKLYDKAGKLTASITYKNDKIVSGRFPNGKRMTVVDLQKYGAQIPTGVKKRI